MNNKYRVIGFDVDTQRDFMEGKQDNVVFYEGKLKIDDAIQIAPNLERLTNCLWEMNVPIFGSIDWHSKNSKEFPKIGEMPNFGNTFPEHCVKNTYGSEKIDATRPIDPLYVDHDFDIDFGTLMRRIRTHQGEVFFRKDNFNVFETVANEIQGLGNPYTTKVLEALAPEKAIVYGVATDVCVDFAIKGLRELGTQVYAVEDCMRGLNPVAIKEKMQDWQTGKNPAKIIKLDDVICGRF